MSDPAGLDEDEIFFWFNAGWSYDPATTTSEQGHADNARALAAAEKRAKDAGWVMNWEPDIEASLEEIREPNPLVEMTPMGRWIGILAAEMPDGTTRILAVLGDIGFGHRYDVTPEDDPQARVIAAELALQAITEMEKNNVQ